LELHVPVFVAHEIPVCVSYEGTGVKEKTKFGAPMRAKNIVVCGDAMSVNFALGICGNYFLLRWSAMSGLNGPQGILYDHVIQGSSPLSGRPRGHKQRSDNFLTAGRDLHRGYGKRISTKTALSELLFPTS
jgi:hypothetical protein